MKKYKRDAIRDELTEEKMKELYIDKNMRLVDIAKMFGVSRDTVMRLRKEYGMERKPRTMAAQITKITCQEKYGVDNVMKNKDILKKAQNTCIQKYGSWYCQTDEFNKKYKGKSSATNVTRTLSMGKLNNISHEISLAFLNEENAREYIISNNLVGKTVKELSDITGYQYTSMCEICRDLNLYDLIEKLHGSSYYEEEISNYLKSIGITNIIYNSRKILSTGEEIDIYLPDYKFGIEFNGNYWHSSICKSKSYHYAKSLTAEKQKIHLFHIFQYEWDDARTQNIIKSLLKIATVGPDNKIYARKCSIREISNDEAREFNHVNHFQDHRNAQITYGLFYNDELVQLMSFSKHKEYDWEIIRGCPGSNNIVIGGVSKLFKHFIDRYKPKTIFSYCDFNKFDGHGYEAIGMKFIGYTGPDKTWIVSGKPIKRNPKKYKEYKESAEYIIWGAGSKRYLWKSES